MILSKETLLSLNIFSSFTRRSRVTDLATLVFEGSRGGMLRVEDFCNLVLFLAFDNNRSRSAEQWLERQGILGSRLEKFN